MRSIRRIGAVVGAAALAGCAVMLGPTSRLQSGAPEGGPLYYSDLGPNEIDVSSYPRVQQDNYKVYARACSQCHTLARSVNAPMVNRRYWEFYLMGMRFNARFKPETRMTQAEIESILSFLEYDAQVRKVQHREAFEKQSDELERRFEPILDAQLRRLMDSLPASIKMKEPR